MQCIGWGRSTTSYRSGLFRANGQGSRALADAQGHAGHEFIPLKEYSLKAILIRLHWDVEYTDDFGEWWAGMSEDEQESLAASVRLLEERGPNLGFPHSSGIGRSKHDHMRELRTQHKGRPLRTLYAFDPRRSAILLIGGDKTGDDRWYDVYVPMADKLYDEHLEQLRKEGLIDG